jgi:Amt family ammonium transporter
MIWHTLRLTLLRQTSTKWKTMIKKSLTLLGIAGFTSAFAGETEIDTGTTAWMLVSTALVLLMIPGLAMFYGGLVRTKNVLGTMMQSFAAMGVIGVLWVIYGYAMSFGTNVAGGWFGWNPDFFLMSGIDSAIHPAGVPEYVFAMFQGKFAIITPAILAGAFAERVSFKGYIAFIIGWFTLVYLPLCHWVWAGDGFLLNHGAMGAIDFAGGTVVHISAGISGLAVALFIGARKGYKKVKMSPNNMVMTLMGAGLLWVGWFGFNAGSAVSSGLDTARALTVTQTAAAAGAVIWMLLEKLHTGKATGLGVVSGILAGLVAITPAAGVVKVGGALALGSISALICYGMLLLKEKKNYDDTLDAFGIHGVGGIVGAVFLVFFIRESWWTDAQAAATQAGLGTWGIGSQLWVQIFAILVTIGYAVVMSLLLAFIIKKTVGLRLEEDEEKQGLDKSQHAESGYGFLDIQ